jgi:hypothetical protein
MSSDLLEIHSKFLFTLDSPEKSQKPVTSASAAMTKTGQSGLFMNASRLRRSMKLIFSAIRIISGKGGRTS